MGSINIEVVYARPYHQALRRVLLAAGATVIDAVKRSGVLEEYPEIDLSRNKLGVYGKLTSGDAILRDRDRVEIYRELIADPIEARRTRAGQSRARRLEKN
jgi:putative ubiquitin-RnfH superfamily antitoxin RatB of RatAB toxin-antitoxin module